MRINVCNRATTGADFNDIQHRSLQWKALFITADVIAALNLETLVLDERAFRSRPTHVERDQPVGP